MTTVQRFWILSFGLNLILTTWIKDFVLKPAFISLLKNPKKGNLMLQNKALNDMEMEK